MSTVLGGYILNSDSQRHQLPVISNPDEFAIKEALLTINDASGVVVLRYTPEPESGPYELLFYSENGNFLLMLNEFDKDGDCNVRTITAPGVEDGLVSILGECYPAKSVTRDFKIAYSIFKEFADTGNVSKKIMS